MASIKERYRKIKIAPAISLARQSWIRYIEQYGFVWDDERGDWFFMWDGVKYWGADLSEQEWKDNIFKFGQRFGLQVKKEGTYELRKDDPNDPNSPWYYYNTLGQKIYTPDNQDPSADIFVWDTIVNAPSSYDFSDELSNETIRDILGNPILPKKPEVGLYNTKSYLDSIDKKIKVYKQFYSAKTQPEKINAISVRAADIIAEQSQLISDLNKAGASIKRENAIVNSVVGSFGGVAVKSAGVIAGLNPIGIGLSVFAFVKKYAAAKTTGRREQLRAEDLLYLEEELNAIKAYIQKNVASSDSGEGNKNTIYWVIGGIIVLVIIVYFAIKRWQ